MMLAQLILSVVAVQRNPQVGVHVESWNDYSRGKTVYTASTVEVDIMPFLARVDEGGPFAGYQKALKELGAEFVRFSPWYPYPKVAVAELTPPDCTATKPATNWNSTLFDGIMKDFMEAVCGPNAVKGECPSSSVAQQLSTMPSWLYVDGTDPKTIREDPWQYNGFGDYDQGTALKDESCVPLAQYMARLVAWYTAGGFHDTCGHYHASGFHYNWTVLSVLNENEHNTGQERYTTCWDAIRSEVEKINSYITLAGPETCPASYTGYLLDPKNHKDGRVPDILSYHYYGGMYGGSNSSFEGFFKSFDGFFSSTIGELNSQRDSLAPTSEFVINEFIPFMNDWCNQEDATALFERYPDLLTDAEQQQSNARFHSLLPSRTSEVSTGCPNWQDPRTTNVTVNRATLGWSAAAAVFAYGYGRLALAGYKYVGADQLIGGPWPDNEPAVSSLDWKTGEPNAKYYAVQMLAKHLKGSSPKTLLPVEVDFTYLPPAPTPPGPPAAGTTGNGTCGATAYGGDCNTAPTGAWQPSKFNITSLQDCVSHAKSCKMANFVSYSNVPDNQDCSWYSVCDFEHLCEDCSKCGIGCPKYFPYESEVLHAVNPPAPSPAVPIFALPYVLHSGKDSKGLLLISKVPTDTDVKLLSSSLMGDELVATVLEGTGAEPGFGGPTTRPLTAAGELTIGPYGIVIVEAA